MKEDDSLVDVLVQTLVVEDAVRDVVPCVFHDEEESELGIESRGSANGNLAEAIENAAHLAKDRSDGGKRKLISLHANRSRHGVEEVDLGQRGSALDFRFETKQASSPGAARR